MLYAELYWLVVSVWFSKSIYLNYWLSFPFCLFKAVSCLLMHGPTIQYKFEIYYIVSFMDNGFGLLLPLLGKILVVAWVFFLSVARDAALLIRRYI